jgi:trk/ktr system potassium uptake protein
VAVCVGERLETAVLLVHHLHQWKLPRILVKVTNDEQAEIVQLVGATEVIHPEQSSARKAALLIPYSQKIQTHCSTSSYASAMSSVSA